MLKYKDFINENINNLDEVRDFIVEYLEENCPKERMDNFFYDRVDNYIEEDVLEYGETAQDAYSRLSLGGAIEFDMIGEITKEICKEFKIKEKDFYKNRLDDLIVEHMVMNVDWYDTFLFGPDKL